MRDALVARARSGARAFRNWIESEPNRKLETADTEVAPKEALVSSDYVVRLVLECISSRTPIVLSGPRGCGKTFCVLQALEQAIEKGFVFGVKDNRTTWGYVMAQGNKELPREYLMEDEARVGGVRGNVALELKEAPLLSFAARNSATGVPTIADDGRLVIDPKHNAGDKPFVLFLDEINRFSDGVLDSLLLLLEEGEVIRDGRRIRLDCAVVMTMNPPGYDGTAKRLSPPLQARLGRVLQLCTPDFTTTYAISLGNLAKAKIPIAPGSDDDLALKRACLASIALWGQIKADSAAYRYLTPQTRELLDRLSIDTTLRKPMALLAHECSYGPDVRGVRYWFSAAHRRRQELLASMRGAQPKGLLEQCLLDTFGQTMLHRLSTRFVEATSARQLGEVESAAWAVVSNIMMIPPPSKNSKTWSPLRTVFDELADVADDLMRLWGVTPSELRTAWQGAGRSSDSELVAFALSLAPKDAAGKALSGFSECLSALEGTGIIFKVENLDVAKVTAECYTRRRELMRVVSQRRAGLLTGPSVTWFYSPRLFADTRADDFEELLQRAYDAYPTQVDWAKTSVDDFLKAPASPTNSFPNDSLLRLVVQQYRDDGSKHANIADLGNQLRSRYADQLVECNRRLKQYLQNSSLREDPAADAVSAFLAAAIIAWDSQRPLPEKARMRAGAQSLDWSERQQLRERMLPRPEA